MSELKVRLSGEREEPKETDHKESFYYSSKMTLKVDQSYKRNKEKTVKRCTVIFL